MRPDPPRSGHTLLELAVALTLLGMALSAILPSVGRLADATAVRGAREAVAALAVRARSEALRHGGARLLVDASTGTARVVVAGMELERVGVEEVWGVELSVAGAAADADLWFDALGIGRVASLTVGFTRGRASAGLVFSAYGRVRRVP